MIQTVVATAAKPTTAAAIARMVSTLLSVATATGAAGRAAVVAVRCATGAAVPTRGAGAAGAAMGAGTNAGVETDEAPVGPPGGSVGNLIVGAAEGFGGRLMRTVSFLG